MESPIKCIILKGAGVLIAEISLNSTENDGLIEWQLVNPFEIKKNENNFCLEPWLLDYTSKRSFTIYSDAIITITDPNKEHLKKYIDLVS